MDTNIEIKLEPGINIDDCDNTENPSATKLNDLNLNANSETEPNKTVAVCPVTKDVK